MKSLVSISWLPAASGRPVVSFTGSTVGTGRFAGDNDGVFSLGPSVTSSVISLPGPHSLPSFFLGILCIIEKVSREEANGEGRAGSFVSE